MTDFFKNHLCRPGRLFHLRRGIPQASGIAHFKPGQGRWSPAWTPAARQVLFRHPVRHPTPVISQRLWNLQRQTLSSVPCSCVVVISLFFATNQPPLLAANYMTRGSIGINGEPGEIE